MHILLYYTVFLWCWKAGVCLSIEWESSHTCSKFMCLLQTQNIRARSCSTHQQIINNNSPNDRLKIETLQNCYSSIYPSNKHFWYLFYTKWKLLSPVWLCVSTAVSDGKESACNSGDPGLILGLGRFPGEGNGYPLQFSCLENSMDKGASGLQSMGSQRVRHDWAAKMFPFTILSDNYLQVE